MYQVVNKGEYIFRWQIKNFSFAIEETGEALDSPPFVVGILDETKWCLSIYPRGKEDGEFIDKYLTRCSDGGGEVQISIIFTIELEAADSSRRERRVSQTLIFERNSSLGFQQYIRRETLLEDMKSTFLPDDILTIECKLQRDPPNLDYSREYIIATGMETVETEFKWTIRNWSEIVDFCEVYKDAQFNGDHEAIFRLWICPSDDSEKDLVLKLKKLEPKDRDVSLSCRISVLDAEGDEVLTQTAHHHFSDASETNFQKCCEDVKDFRLPDDTLSLRCVLSMETGKEAVKKTEMFHESDEEAKKRLMKELAEDFENMFLSGNFSDVKLRSGSKVVDCHKGISFARSQVLSDLLTKATEKVEGSLVIDIDDLDGDTLEQMVYYMYSDKINNIKLTSTLKLFVAGHKYQIKSLKRKCSLYLCNVFSFENVYILLAAHIYKDGELKRRAISYISEYFSRICLTTEWETFRKTEKELGAYVCQEIRRIKQF